MSPLITSKTLRECRNGLNCIYRFNTMKLLREVGHCHVEVNEISYAFNLISPIPGPEPAIGVSVAFAKVVIKSWEQASHMDRWQILNVVSTHQTVPAWDKQTYFKVYPVEKQDFVGILTGHNLLAEHMFRIRLLQNDSCPFCNKELECQAYFLCECPTYEYMRHQIPGTDIFQLYRVASHLVTKNLWYIYLSKIFH